MGGTTWRASAAAPAARSRAPGDRHRDVTEDVADRLRRAVELMLGAIGRAERHARRAGPVGAGASTPAPAVVPVDDIYRAVSTVVLRVLVLQLAERCPRPGVPQNAPAPSTPDGLVGRPGQAGTAWTRLSARFADVHARLGHPDPGPDRTTPITLFDPSAFGWLTSLPVDDDTVRHLLRVVRDGARPGRVPLSDIDVEQVGHGYEHLLSYAAARADTVMVGVGHEHHLPLDDLTELAARHPDRRQLAAALTGRRRISGFGSPATVAKRLGPLGGAERATARAELLVVTAGDGELVDRLLPFVRIVRRDPSDRPVVILPGAPYLVRSALRRSSGAHYTPPALADEVVRHALAPLLYHVGPLQTADRDRWRPRSGAEILDLRVVDIAMGSGAVLLAAARYLAAALADAWRREGTPEPDTGAARRAVVDHCLFGVDVNPTAVQMAAVSLWLLVGEPDRRCPVPAGRLRVGDALLGITDADQAAALVGGPAAGADRPWLRDALTHPSTPAQRRRAALLADLAVGVALAARVRRPRTGPRRTPAGGSGPPPAAPDDRGSPTDHDPAATAGRWRRVVLAREFDTLAQDLLTGRDPALDPALDIAVDIALDPGVDPGPAAARSRAWLATDQPPGTFPRVPVHWPLAFPAVFRRGGFDAVVGNPPFLGGQKLTGALGRAYRELLVDTVGRGARGSADLVAYFLLRAHQLLRAGGQTGLIATNTLAQGDTREVGLDQLVADGTTIRRALRSARWPAPGAALEYCAVWTSTVTPGPDAERHLDGRPVPIVGTALEPVGRARPRQQAPAPLPGNARRCFVGSYVLGLGFTMPPEQAAALLAADPRHADVLFPYLSGRDLNAAPDTAAGRWVIDFHDWSEDRARGYPDCYARLAELVRPDRQRNGRAVYRRYWWQHAEKRPALRAAIAGLSRVVVIALVSRTVMPVLVPTGQVFSHKLGVFASDDPALLGVLSAAPHYWWTRSRSSTIKADINYSPSDVFETLPLPAFTPELRALGTRLDRYRRQVMLARRTGLTASYNLVSDPHVRDADVVELRDIHRALDRCVLRAYGWDDLLDRLDHGIRPAGRELRYTIGEPARREILDRLVALNHERRVAAPAGPTGGEEAG